jgi:hypothetical protein
MRNTKFGILIVTALRAQDKGFVAIAKKAQKRNAIFKTFLSADYADFFAPLRLGVNYFSRVVAYQANHPVRLRLPPLHGRGIYRAARPFVPSLHIAASTTAAYT